MKQFSTEIIKPAFLFCILVFLTSASNNSEKNLELLDDKGSAFDIDTPAWVTAYLAGGNEAVEKLKPYKNKYCFVVFVSDADKDYAITFANNLSEIVDGTKNISFSGARKEGDWWQLVLDKTTNAETYRSFVLWTKAK